MLHIRLTMVDDNGVESVSVIKCDSFSLPTHESALKFEIIDNSSPLFSRTVSSISLYHVSGFSVLGYGGEKQ